MGLIYAILNLRVHLLLAYFNSFHTFPTCTFETTATSGTKCIPERVVDAWDAKNKWKQLLAKSVSTAIIPLKKVRERYNRNYDARLRQRREKIEKSDYFYLRVECHDGNEHRHNLASFSAGPYLVLDVDGKTVALAREDKTFERVSRDRVTFAPTPQTNEELQRNVRPMIVE